MVAPDGPVYQAGTLSGNPLATAAGVACLRQLVDRPEVYERLEDLGAGLETALAESLRAHGVPGCVQRVGAMLTVFFGPSSVRSWDDAATVDRGGFARFFQASYERGVLLPPSQFEALFLMQSHEAVIDEVIASLTAAVGAAA
jgi:glutamate-1-semialdehyde 2,1-aminomutase